MQMGFGSGMSAAPRSCHSCKSASAAVFCRVDAVALCFSCDTRIHSRASHERVWMCEVCEQAPAAFTCKADAAALCFSCDSTIHSANPLAQRHERVPVQPLFESAESMVKSSVLSLLVLSDDEDATAAAADGLFISSKCPHDQDAEAEIDNWLLPYPNTKDNIQAADVGGFFDETDPLLDFGFGDSVDRFPVTLSDALVPDQQKPVQLPAVKQLSENRFDAVDFGRPGNPISSPFSYRGQSPGHKVVSSPSFDVGVVPDGSSNMSDISYPPVQTSGDSSLANSALPNQSAPASQLTGADRKARVMRYREKRKNRKFEKTIRYASRKAYAETRPRIRGRFTKRAEVKHEEDCLHGAAHQYGFVPGFLIRPR